MTMTALPRRSALSISSDTAGAAEATRLCGRMRTSLLLLDLLGAAWHALAAPRRGTLRG